MEIRFNGLKITSASQFERELKRAVEKHVGDGDSLKRAAGPGMRMKKTPEGYSFEGTPTQIERMRRRLW